jgi:hypothetical protein
MKKFGLIGLMVLVVSDVLIGCDFDSGTTPPIQETISASWSITGQLGSKAFTDLGKDTTVVALSALGGTSTLKINGYDTSRFADSISIGHLQSSRFITVKIDSSGTFSFDNIDLFGFSEGGHSIRISPRAKPFTVLVPQNILVFGSM